MSKRDYYDILGVARGADEKEIKSWDSWSDRNGWTAFYRPSGESPMV